MTAMLPPAVSPVIPWAAVSVKTDEGGESHRARHGTRSAAKNGRPRFSTRLRGFALCAWPAC